MKWIKAFLAIFLTILLVYALNRTFGIVPALGPFLSPYQGFWRNGEADQDFKSEELALPGLQAPVQVRFDSLRIPHVFAQNDHDLYYAQGYLTARDRLWQMEFMTHAAAGRLSELIGKDLLERDRYQRRMGMVFSAEQFLEKMRANPKSHAVMNAYTAGVNAYIDQLSPTDYPLEYKLLHYAPEKFTPLRIALILKMLAMDMTGYSDDLRMTNVLRQYGPAVVKDLYPDYPLREEPILPEGTKLDFTPLPIPPAPQGFMAETAWHTLERQKPENLGSNNWAVLGTRTANGYPLLASDPHLGLSLPSIWYAIQLHAPGINVFGVTIPGAPGIGIGFNEHIAWGMTNTGPDVLDWFEIKFKDQTRQQYWHDNQWKTVRRVVEEIKVKGGATVIDTVLYTHHGPVAYLPHETANRITTPTGHAARWTGHNNQNELLALYTLNRAHNYQQFRAGLAYWAAPAFNFVYADKQNIAMVVNGLFPLKWTGQGKFLLDGTDPAHDWQGWVPMNQVPAVMNPERGFVSSANQIPAHPKDYPYYLGSSFAGYERSARINERLARMTQATPDSFRLMQTDNYSFVPRNVLPPLLRLLDQASLTAPQKKAYQTLAAWDYRFDPEKTAPSIFEEWWQSLARAIWMDEFPAEKFKAPSRDRLVHMILEEPNARWFDNVTTPQKETLAQLANQTFKKVADSLAAHGGKQWEWGNAKNSSIRHLAQLPGFGHKLYSGGSANSINALNGGHGPSWRMVVEMGPQVQAWGVYPGGQSGNPGSSFYDNQLEDWRTGKLHRLLFLRSAADRPAATVVNWVLTKK